MNNMLKSIYYPLEVIKLFLLIIILFNFIGIQNQLSKLIHNINNGNIKITTEAEYNLVKLPSLEK